MNITVIYKILLMLFSILYEIVVYCVSFTSAIKILFYNPLIEIATKIIFLDI